MLKKVIIFLLIKKTFQILQECQNLPQKKICGSNGITYKNECFIKKEKNTEIIHFGKCSNCSKCKNENIFLVCGENKKTYLNKCEANCRNIKISYFSKCKKIKIFKNKIIKKNCSCSLKKNLVCGENGITYENECFAKCDNIKINYLGICNQICKCFETEKFVCGIDGKKYINSCIANCIGVEISDDDRCLDFQNIVENNY